MGVKSRFKNTNRSNKITPITNGSPEKKFSAFVALAIISADHLDADLTGTEGCSMNRELGCYVDKPPTWAKMMTRSWSLPNATDPDVLELNRMNRLSGVPILVPFQDNGYQPAFCHISAKDMAMRKGGKRVHGWSYWRVTDEQSGQRWSMMMAEHHSVWEIEAGDLVDVTPPRHGGEFTLFLRDDAANIASAMVPILRTLRRGCSSGMAKT